MSETHDEFVERVAIQVHVKDSDNETLKWSKQPGKYRASIRRDVRDVLDALDLLSCVVAKKHDIAAKDAEIARLTNHWQPIETAPKDGTLIILHDSVRVASGVGRWRQVSSRDTLNDIDGLAQFSRQYGWRSASDKSIENATHWMPLPAAPKGGEA